MMITSNQPTSLGVSYVFLGVDTTEDSRHHPHLQALDSPSKIELMPRTLRVFTRRITLYPTFRKMVF